MLQPGAMLHGRYRIEKAIQEGGMSVVYRAQDSSVDITVAVKEMKDPFLDEGERRRAVAEFHKEAKILASLSHAGLPRVTHFFESSPSYYVIMDFIEGQTLDYAATRYNNQVPEHIVLNWAWQICDVLHYLHERKPPIIFRDLKPANIMVTPDDRIKLIDFGIAKIFEPESVTHTLIRGAGTPGFAPPEQYGQIGRSHTDVRTDIYALGATLYSLLQGVLPVEATARFMHNEPLAPLTMPRREVHDVVMRCLELLPDHRYQTVAQVMAALKPLVFPPESALSTPTKTRMPGVLPAAAPTNRDVSPPPSPPAPPPAPPAPAPPPIPVLPELHTRTRTRTVTAADVWQRWGPVAAILAVGVLLGSQIVPLTRPQPQPTPTPPPSPSGHPSPTPIATLPPSASPGAVVVVPTVSASPVATTGTVHLSAEPPTTRIEVDGDTQASVIGSVGFDLALQPGAHRFKAFADGYAPQSMTVTVQAGQRTDLHVVLQPPTQMRITSSPKGMVVKVNGIRRGLTPMVLNGLTPGEYHVTLTRPGYQTYDKKVPVGQGQITVLDADISKVDAPVSLPPRPAQVYTLPIPQPRPWTAPPRHSPTNPEGPKATPM